MSDSKIISIMNKYVSREEKADLNNLIVVEFDGIKSTAVYLGGVTRLKKVNEELIWHEEESEALYSTIKSLTLREIYDQISQKYGYQIITVIVDGPMHGEIYQCGNYVEGQWVKYGMTMGYT